MGNLASTYSGQGKFGEAEQLEVQVIEVRKRVLGAEHPGTLKSMGNLASTYSGQGKFGEAEQLEVQVIEVGKRVLGSEHPDTLTNMNNYAITLKSLGRANEAIDMMTDVVALLTKVLGDKHPNTRKSRDTLANWKAESGKRRCLRSLLLNHLERRNFNRKTTSLPLFCSLGGVQVEA
ncbi:hypothetical protein BDD12DRAFT_829275 [Trichophaea hybrida]|nr:hypothetical protein BDD12DRAFT_829275 [Trichophaea hybrida]